MSNAASLATHAAMAMTRASLATNDADTEPSSAPLAKSNSNEIPALRPSMPKPMPKHHGPKGMNAEAYATTRRHL